MALHSSKEPSKLIFAPSGSAPNNAQAEQFTQHEQQGLHRSDLDATSPTAQFHAWFRAAQQQQQQQQQPDTGAGAGARAVAHPETCTLSTAALPSGRVSSRVVYLKELDARGGFVVYTNLGTSRKAADLATNPWASLAFWWEALERQVRVEGRAERLPPAESQVYFDTRVRGSRVGAWASRQSRVLRPRADVPGDDGRAQLDDWVREADARFEGRDDIPVPEFWGGLRIVPERVEFWQGRANRLHDRFVYERKRPQDGDEGAQEKGEVEWTLERLSP